jgi:MscS family membrane protein
MNNFENWLDVSLGGNEVWRILTLFGILLFWLVVGKILRYFGLKSVPAFQHKNRPVVADFLGALSKSALLAAFTLGARQGIAVLVLAPRAEAFTLTLLSVLSTVTVGFVVYNLVDVVSHAAERAAARTESKLDDMLVPMIRNSLHITVVILVLIQIATLLSDKPLTSVLAGLGVGGLAIALAAQETIKNFFGSLMILTDKPFELGDRVVIGDIDGPVEKVGFRSTRIRTLDGHLVTIPNSSLADAAVKNISKRPYIRRLSNITITYDTPPAKVHRALAILKELLNNHEGIHPDFPPRVYFNEFNADALNLIMIYWYHPPDYWSYMAFSERLNLEILRRFNAEGIEFAFPTQTLFLAGDPRRPIAPPPPASPAG